MDYAKFNVRTHVKMHAIAHGECKDTVGESTLKVDWEKNLLPHRGIEPASAVCRSDALPTELHPHPYSILRAKEERRLRGFNPSDYL